MPALRVRPALYALALVIIAITGCVLLGADMRTMWLRLTKRALRRSRS